MNSLKDQIFEYVKKYRSVTYAELNQNIVGFRGNRMSLVPEIPSIVYWSGLSDEAYEAIAELLNEKRVFHNASTPQQYLRAGGGLTIPIVKSNKITKELRWLPVVLSVQKE
ncbi:hypothetical protein [Acidovorax sp. SUPP3334]|uniref:hypothetical protein n=1 Tax=Acidovorax sp. SUPP3334 TaxID=2920881 RepID=UPI0023DE45D6|nr:hypothetical protein [Acidovorax sp. SUPP3334]GKT26747.1 hypothetical protein AVHM3334_21895 [Acidovorax sp. SUPP3334]